MNPLINKTSTNGKGVGVFDLLTSIWIAKRQGSRKLNFNDRISLKLRMDFKSLSPEDLIEKAPTYISLLQQIISEQNETIRKQKLASQAVSLMNIAKLADKAIGFIFPTDEHFFDFLPSKDQIQQYVYAEMMTPIEEQIGYITLEYVLEEWVMYIKTSDEDHVSLNIQPNDVKKLLEKILENNLQISIGYDEYEHDIEMTIWDVADKLETI